MARKTGIALLFILLFYQLFGISDSLLVQLPDSFNSGNPHHYIHFSSVMLNEGKYDIAKKLIDEGIAWGEQEHDQYLKTNLLYYLADYYYFTQKYQKAMGIYKQVLPEFRSLTDTVMIAKTLNSIGLLYNFQHDKENALKYYLEEVELLNNTDQENKKYVLERVVVFTNILNLYSNENQHEKVLQTAPQAIELAKSINDSLRLASLYNTQALAYKNLNQYEQSMQTFRKAASIFSAIDDDFSKAFVELNIGGLYERSVRYDSALFFYNNSFNMFKKHNYAYGFVYALSGMASVYDAIGREDIARGLYLKCIDSCNVYEFNQLLLEAYTGLASLEYEQGNYKVAFDLELKYVALNDSLNNLEKEKQFVELQTKYETIQKENEINKLKSENIVRLNELKRNRLLKRVGFSLVILMLIFFYIFYRLYSQKNKINIELTEKNNQIELQNEQLKVMNQHVQQMNQQLKKSQLELEKANSAKNRFFSILAHDLRNPFHNILGESYLLSHSYKKLSDEERVDYANDIYKSCDHVNKLLDNLLEWTRTQTKGIEFKPKMLNLRKVSEESLAILKGGYSSKFIVVENKIVENINLKADYSMLEAIFRNLINNSIKFTPVGGQISLTTSVVDHSIVVCVEDNGVGIEKSDIDKLFHIDSNLKTRGTNNETGSGLGLVICMEFVKCHKGKIWVESSPGKGSKFYFSLPGA
ncbi:MAG: tetratricopeptide repeat-containing sensor histidine kinase [Prolixibacteraceae bacterium]|nr:tetratricopeptide repeat-containing sensor histidine kinase [Prolixibacteraceae bacterium]